MNDEYRDEYPEGTKLLFDSSSGQYIPQRFATEMKREYIEGVDAEDWDGITDLEGEGYWEAWDSVLGNAVLTDPETGQRYRLDQDGDVWLIPIEETEE